MPQIHADPAHRADDAVTVPDVSPDTFDARVFLLLMASRLVGDHLYAWGGEASAEGGYDCSGFASVVLTQTARAWPGLYSGGRTTAAGLYGYYDRRGCPDLHLVDDLAPGCLVFYRRPGRTIHHVAIHSATVPSLQLEQGSVPVGPLAFESAGSGSDATSPRTALLASAGIRLSASDYHGAGVEWVAKDPFTVLGGEG